MKRVLKKVTAALLAATMVVGLAACGSGNGGSGNKSSKSGRRTGTHIPKTTSSSDAVRRRNSYRKTT